MKTIIHLAGEQPLPVYIGVMQFDCPRHILAVTDRTTHVGETVRNVCSATGRDVELLKLDAYDMQASVHAIETLLAGQKPAEWGFNLTGGTKPMFAAAYKAAQQMNATPFYIETTNHTVDWLDGSGRQEPLRPVIPSVGTFIQLAGYESMPAPEAPSPLNSVDGLRLLEAMWKQRDKLQGWYRTIGRHMQYPGVPFSESQTNLKGLKVSAELKGPREGYAGTLRIDHDEITLSPWPTIAKFICGGWLEDYLFHKLQDLYRQKKITDLCENLYVTAADTTSKQQDPFQEFDLAFSDGFFLTVVECKAGDIDQSHIQKLENLARRFGGHFGRGILVAGRADRLDPIRERIERSSIISAVAADVVVRKPDVLLNIPPGSVLASISESNSRHRR